jgi:hypothetical protein
MLDPKNFWAKKSNFWRRFGRLHVLNARRFAPANDPTCFFRVANLATATSIRKTAFATNVRGDSYSFIARCKR